MGKPIPLTPSTQRSGGMLDDIVATITEARAVMFDYDGHADVEVPALRLTLEDEDGEGLNPQHYKAGDPAKVQPTDDGMNFEPVDEDAEYEGVGKKTLCGTFLRLLDEASKGKFEKHARKVGDLSCLEGITARFEMVPKPKTGMGDQKYPDFPVITEIIDAPWGKGKGGSKDAAPTTKATKTKGGGKQKAIDEDEDDEDDDDDEEAAAPPAKKSKAAKKAAPAEDDEAEEADEDEDEGADEDAPEAGASDGIEARATAALRKAVKVAGEPLARARAAQAVREAIRETDDDWKEIVTTILQEKFLKAGAKAGRWSFDGMKVGPAK